jgi:hypothetical protein
MNAALSRDANLPFEHWMRRAAYSDVMKRG